MRHFAWLKSWLKPIANTTDDTGSANITDDNGVIKCRTAIIKCRAADYGDAPQVLGEEPACIKCRKADYGDAPQALGEEPACIKCRIAIIFQKPLSRSERKGKGWGRQATPAPHGPTSHPPPPFFVGACLGGFNFNQMYLPSKIPLYKNVL